MGAILGNEIVQWVILVGGFGGTLVGLVWLTTRLGSDRPDHEQTHGVDHASSYPSGMPDA